MFFTSITLLSPFFHNIFLLFLYIMHKYLFHFLVDFNLFSIYHFTFYTRGSIIYKEYILYTIEENYHTTLIYLLNLRHLSMRRIYIPILHKSHTTHHIHMQSSNDAV